MLLLTADEEGKIGLWRYKYEEREIALIQSFSIDVMPSSLCWDLSGFSAVVLGAAKGTDSPTCWRVEASFEQANEWKLAVVASQNDK